MVNVIQFAETSQIKFNPCVSTILYLRQAHIELHQVKICWTQLRTTPNYAHTLILLVIIEGSQQAQCTIITRNTQLRNFNIIQKLIATSHTLF